MTQLIISLGWSGIFAAITAAVMLGFYWKSAKD
jgi:Na+/proline symporter